MSEKKRLGQLGETAFLHRATELRLIVSQPFGDNERYDFIVDNDYRLMRIQVKTTASLRHGNAYEVHTGRRLSPSGRTSSPIVPYLKSEVDFIVVYLEPEKTWYIIPVTALAGRTTLVFFSNSHTRQVAVWAYREAWHLLLARKETTLPWGQASRRRKLPSTTRRPASATQ